MLEKIFKQYDVRGLVGEELTIENVKAIGAAFVTTMGLTDSKIIIGYDMRPSSMQLSDAFADGAAAAGVKEIQTIGLTSTDGLYFASGKYGSPAVMFTASHNPAEYNGIKICMAGALGLSKETGLEEIKNQASIYLEEGMPDKPNVMFKKYHTSILKDYVEALRETVNLENAKPLKIVVDAGNGMGGYITPPVFEGVGNMTPLPYKITPMFFTLDGSFPNHPADPLNPENIKDLQLKVLETQADIGLAFDGDADRCFIVDEKGQPVPPSAISAIIAKRLLEDDPNATVLYTKTTSKIFKETIENNGGEPYLIKVGHSTAKQAMRDTGAVFGGEHSAHYYFKNFYGADTGMLAALYVLQELNITGLTMSELAKQFNPYYSSGEINSTAENVEKIMGTLLSTYSKHLDWDDFDGLYFHKQLTDDSWVWFNVRSSNTEPLLRLNVESNSKAVLNHVTNEILNLIRST